MSQLAPKSLLRSVRPVLEGSSAAETIYRPMAPHSAFAIGATRIDSVIKPRLAGLGFLSFVVLMKFPFCVE
jgi:hypothetical protein